MTWVYDERISPVHVVLCLLLFCDLMSVNFDLINYFDSEIVLSLSASLGKTLELNLLYYDNFP